MEKAEDKYALIDTEVEILDTVNSTEALEKVLASKKENKDGDLMYLKFRFVHEGANKNKDAFEIDDLRERHTTAIYKPLNLEHNSKKIIGTIYDTEFLEREDSENGKAAVNIFAVMYKGLFPNIAKEIKKKHEKGKLSCSMETWYNEVKCSVCGSTYENEEDYCEHLKSRFSKAANERILKGITFGGCGVVGNPADPDANAIALASKVDFKESETEAEVIADISEETSTKTEAGDLKNSVEKQIEKSRFITILREAENMYYNIVYRYYPEEDLPNKKKELNGLIDEMKVLLDTVNVNKIVKGEVNTMNSNIMDMKPEQLADAFMAKAIMENKEAFTRELAEKLEQVKADYEAKIAEVTGEAEAKLNTLKTEKEAVEKEYATFKANVEKANVIAERKSVLAEKKIDVSFEDDDTLYSMSDKVFDLFIKANAVKAPVAPAKAPVTDVPENGASAVAAVADADNKVNKDEETLRNILNKL